LITNVNLKNQGQIANLPLDVVVETNAHFSHDEVRPLAAGSLPDGLASLIQRHSANQEMIVTAALEQDKDLAFQAIYNDPTNSLTIDRTWEMFKEMLLASREFYPVGICNPHRQVSHCHRSHPHLLSQQTHGLSAWLIQCGAVTRPRIGSGTSRDVRQLESISGNRFLNLQYWSRITKGL
jgi:hypothetical protein